MVACGFLRGRNSAGRDEAWVWTGEFESWYSFNSLDKLRLIHSGVECRGFRNIQHSVLSTVMSLVHTFLRIRFAERRCPNVLKQVL